MKEEGDTLSNISNWLSFDGRGPIGLSQVKTSLQIRAQTSASNVTTQHNTTQHNKYLYHTI